MIEKNKWTKILFHKVLSFTLEWVRTHPHKYTVVQNWTDKHSLYTALFKIDYRIFSKFWNWKGLKHAQRNCYETIVSAFTIRVILVVMISRVLFSFSSIRLVSRSTIVIL